MILQLAARLEVEQHDRHAAASEQRHLTVTVSCTAWFVAQSLALDREVEQVLASRKALPWRCSLDWLRRRPRLCFLGAHAASVPVAPAIRSIGAMPASGAGGMRDDPLTDKGHADDDHRGACQARHSPRCRRPDVQHPPGRLGAFCRSLSRSGARRSLDTNTYLTSMCLATHSCTSRHLSKEPVMRTHLPRLALVAALALALTGCASAKGPTWTYAPAGDSPARGAAAP